MRKSKPTKAAAAAMAAPPLPVWRVHLGSSIGSKPWLQLDPAKKAEISGGNKRLAARIDPTCIFCNQAIKSLKQAVQCSDGCGMHAHIRCFINSTDDDDDDDAPFICYGCAVGAVGPSEAEDEDEAEAEASCV